MSAHMTIEGRDRLVAELRELKTVERPAISIAIGEAREHGDIKENAEYHAARERQSWIEARISEIGGSLANATVIDISKIKEKKIVFGATVTIVNEDTDEKSTYKLLGEVESDIENGIISITSPIGRSLIGREKGDSFEVNTPRGSRYYEILKVQYKG